MIRDIAIDPSGTSDQIIYSATDSGGVWKTTDGGTNWSPKTDFLPSLNIGAIALDPGNPAIVYAGSGNEANQLDSRAVGIYKSTDGGETWTVIGGTIFSGVAVNRIVLPSPNVLLVASSNGLYRSIDGGVNFGNNAFYNNGNPIVGGNVTDLDLDTSSSATVYASIYGVGILKSSNGGISFPQTIFTTANAAASIGYIAFSQSSQPNNQAMYANVELPGTVAGIFKSKDSGANWSRVSVTTSDIEVCECGYAQSIAVDPLDARLVYVGARGLFKSNDGFDSGLTTGNRVGLNELHADVHTVVFSPPTHRSAQSPVRFYVGTDGGLCSSGDAGASWQILNGRDTCSGPNGALATVLFRQIDIGRGTTANNSYSYGAAQDLGVSSHVPSCAGTPWHFGDGGDGNCVAVDPRDPKHAIAGSDSYMTTTDGQTWQASAALPASPSSTYFDPNGGVAYAAIGNTLYQSKDNAASFTSIHSFPAGIAAATINVAKGDPNVIWVGLGDATVWRSDNVLAGPGSSWVARPIPSPPSNVQPSGIAADPVNAAEAVVTYPASSLQVFRTVDGGVTWNNISGNLPALPVRAVVIDPSTSPHTIVVALDSGVRKSVDLGGDWQSAGLGLPNVHCSSLALDPTAVPSLLRVGTYGRSTFELAFDRQYVDWRNNASQNGTREQPFRTLAQALTAPTTGDARSYAIQTGDYAEGPITISCGSVHAMNGPVTIH
jgi:photosystem II stability/assembly factor-like uncharacterized protein